jgi:hypothetical protein
VTSKHQNGLEKIRFGEMGVQSVAENLDTAWLSSLQTDLLYFLCGVVRNYNLS